MAKRDYYEILGVGRDASGDELKKAYRQLAMKYHPDRNAGDKDAEQRFKELNEAYGILRDDQQRGAYDRFGHAAFEQAGGPGGAGGFDFAGGFADIFDEMFGEFMGGRRGRQTSTRGARSAPITWKSASRTRSRAGRRTFACRPRWPANPVMAAAPKAAPSRSPARPARARQGALAAGLFHDRADLPELPRGRPCHRQSMPFLRRLRPPAEGKDPVGQHPPRGRGRHAHPPRRRGRGRPARRTGGRSLHLHIDQAASGVPARRRQYLRASARFR